MLPLPTDPDVLEALIHARACSEDDRDMLLETLAETVAPTDPAVARQLIAEIKPARRVFAWIRLSVGTHAHDDIAAGLRALTDYVPTPKPDAEDPSKLPTTVELEACLLVLHACATRDWGVGRRACGLLSGLTRLEALELIAARSGRRSDAELLLAENRNLDKETTKAITGKTWYVCLQPPPSSKEKRQCSSDRLRRLIELKAPDGILFHETCLLAERGGVREALALSNMHGIAPQTPEEEQQHHRALALGFALDGDTAQARPHAEALTDHEARARAFLQIYIAKTGAHGAPAP